MQDISYFKTQMWEFDILWCNFFGALMLSTKEKKKLTVIVYLSN